MTQTTSPRQGAMRSLSPAPGKPGPGTTGPGKTDPGKTDPGTTGPGKKLNPGNHAGNVQAVPESNTGNPIEATQDNPTLEQTKKVLPLFHLAARLQEHRKLNHTVVHCHGVFDLLHIGHIKYLQKARTLGDILVVTLTPDHHVNKGPNRPAFEEKLRADALAALDCVDYVAINQWPTAVETIEYLKPDFYVKGSEFKNVDTDITGAVGLEKQAAEKHGGQIAFTDEITFSSSRLIKHHLSEFPEATAKYLESFCERVSFDEIQQVITEIANQKVLVIGETIIDEYQYCEAIGKSSKEPTLAVRAGEKECFAGGILAIANHVGNFCQQAQLITQLGDANSYQSFIEERLHENVATQFTIKHQSPTIVKRRYIDAYFFSKMLEIYEINDKAISSDEETDLIAAIDQVINDVDLVIVADFGHNMINEAVISHLHEKAPFMALNTQANAGNMGYHTISKYPGADVVCVAEKEMRLEARDRTGELGAMIRQVAEERHAQFVMVTQGKKGCMVFNSETESFIEIPALATKIVDRVGAGDTFLSMTAPILALKNKQLMDSDKLLEIASFLGNVAGAEAVATVGHRKYLDHKSFIRHVETLMK